MCTANLCVIRVHGSFFQKRTLVDMLMRYIYRWQCIWCWFLRTQGDTRSSLSIGHGWFAVVTVPFLFHRRSCKDFEETLSQGMGFVQPHRMWLKFPHPRRCTNQFNIFKGCQHGSITKTHGVGLNLKDRNTTYVTKTPCKVVFTESPPARTFLQPCLPRRCEGLGATSGQTHGYPETVVRIEFYICMDYILDPWVTLTSPVACGTKPGAYKHVYVQTGVFAMYSRNHKLYTNHHA